MPRGAGSAAQWLLGLFIVLALIASLLMVFGGDLSLTASLAVIAALWAAVIGAVLVTKYRRQADVAETRNRDLRQVYELQLEREIAARRQYEADVETAIRHELGEETNEEFEALKQQVLALRASLEKLLGNPLPDVPLALRPERRRALGSGLSGIAYAGATDDRVAANLDFASTVPPADAGRHAPAVDEPAPAPAAEVSEVELTEIIPVVTDDAPEFEYGEDHAAGHAGEQVEQTVAYTDSPAADYTATEYEYTSTEYTAIEYAEDPSAAVQREPAQYAQPQYAEAQYADAQYAEAQYAGTQYPAAHYGQQHPQAPYGEQQYAPQQQYAAPQYGGQHAGAYDASSYNPPTTPVPPVPDVPPMPQRGRRGGASDDGAHTGGQPVSELLNRLRDGSGERTSSGRRRRN